MKVKKKDPAPVLINLLLGILTLGGFLLTMYFLRRSMPDEGVVELEDQKMSLKEATAKLKKVGQIEKETLWLVLVAERGVSTGQLTGVLEDSADTIAVSPMFLRPLCP